MSFDSEDQEIIDSVGFDSFTNALLFGGDDGSGGGGSGVDGDDGWSPILAIVSDGARRVLQLVSWTGGTGTPPAGAGQYLGPLGLVVLIGDAVDIRGTQGIQGIQGPPGPTDPNIVFGPATATDNALARFDTATGKLIQNSVAILDDTGNLSTLSGLFTSGVRVGFAGTPVDDRIDIGDANFNLDFGGGTVPVITFDSSDFLAFVRASNTWQYSSGGTAILNIGPGVVGPAANGATTLGTGALAWGDIHLATGKKINFGNGDVLINYTAANVLRFQGGAVSFDAGIFPETNNVGALGSGVQSWAGAFLAGAINFNNGSILITPTTNLLSITGAGIDIPSAFAYKVNNTHLAGLSGNYHIFGNQSGGISLHLGGTADKTNYHSNDSHILRNLAGTIISFTCGIGTATFQAATGGNIGAFIITSLNLSEAAGIAYQHAGNTRWATYLETNSNWRMYDGINGRTHVDYTPGSTGGMRLDSTYFNFGSTSGSSGYGVRDTSGVIEHKDTGDVWLPLRELFRIHTGDVGVTNGTGTQQWFPTNGAVTLDANSTYYFDGVLRLSQGGGVHTIRHGFGGTATVSRLSYFSEGAVHADDTAGATAGLGRSTTTQVAVANATQARDVIYVKGIIVITTGGTLIPQFSFGTAPGGSPLVLAGSFFRLKKLGDNNFASRGTWS